MFAHVGLLHNLKDLTTVRQALGCTFLVEGEAVEVADKALGLEVLLRGFLLISQPRERVDHDTCI